MKTEPFHNEFDVCALGEMIIDCTPIGNSSKGSPMFEGNPGGAPCNVMACLARLGSKVTYIGKVGNDDFGRFFNNVLLELNIDNSGVMFADDLNTTLTFVNINPSGDRSFRFYRENTADVRILEEEVDYSLIDRSLLFHFGSVSMTDPVTRKTTMAAVKYASEQGKIISYDPNYRESIWKDKEEARTVISKGLSYADIVKISSEELEFLMGNSMELEAAADMLRKKYKIQILLVTMGVDGAYGFTGQLTAQCPAYHVHTIDTNGAGDAFMGGFLYSILQLHKPLSQITQKELEAYICFANATGSLTTTGRGSIPAMPDLSQVENCVTNEAFIKP